jgi:hypothetical protein
MTRKVSLLVAAAAFLITACAYYNKVEPGRKTAAGVYSLNTDVAWSARSQGPSEFWTIDGPALQAVFFFPPVADGEPLFGVQTKQETLAPFRKGMSPNEIMELVANTMMRLAETQPYVGPYAGNRVETSGLEPFAFGDAGGFRFETQYLSINGLEYRGILFGAVRKDKLHLIAYTGTRAHYFPKYQRTVEHMLASVRVP